MKKIRCFICDDQLDEVEKVGMIIRGEYMFNICRECSNNIGEVAQVALTRDGLVTELREKCKEVASDEY